MSIDQNGNETGAYADSGGLLARAGRADARASRDLQGVIADLFIPEDARLDDRTRSALETLHARLIATVASEIREHAARLLATRGRAELLQKLPDDPQMLADRLAASGVLSDPGFVAETVARARQQLIATQLAPVAGEADTPSLLARLSNRGDRIVASGAIALMVADTRRRESMSAPSQTDLPAELHHKLVWWVAAGLRDAAGAQDPLLDRAIAEAALRSLAAHDEGDRVEAVAMRLAAAIDAQADELPSLLAEALGDRRLALAIALIAHAIGVEYGLAQEIVLDPAADRLALVLRAFEMDRRQIGRVLLALAEADPRRDEEAVAAQVDAACEVSPEAARGAIVPLTLHPAFRAAVLALAQGRA